MVATEPADSTRDSSGATVRRTERRIGFFPGSFDPPTLGHVEVARRATRLIDRLIVGVGQHHSKNSYLSVAVRHALLRELLAPVARETNVPIEVVTFSSLTVDAANRFGARFLIRGIRAGTDISYELALTAINENLAPEIMTLFLYTPSGVAHISSSLVKQVASLGGDISDFVPSPVVPILARMHADRVPSTPEV